MRTSPYEIELTAVPVNESFIIKIQHRFDDDFFTYMSGPTRVPTLAEQQRALQAVTPEQQRRHCAVLALLKKSTGDEVRRIAEAYLGELAGGPKVQL